MEPERRSVMKLFAIVVLVVAFSVVTVPAIAGEKEALEFLAKLSAIPDQPIATSPAHNILLKERVAKIMIYGYALCRANGFPTGHISGTVTPAMLAEALAEIDGTISTFSVEELRINPGLRVLAGMILH